MNRPPKNIPASVSERLKHLARKENKSFELVLLLYLQERFLYRLSLSPFADRFILKGGLLLYSMTRLQTRPTKDIDFLARRVPNNMESLKEVFRQISGIPVLHDGVHFDEHSVTAERITEDADYQGVRIKVTGYLGKMRRPLQVDIGFGDVVIPKPTTIDYPVLLDMERPHLLAYSVESVVAEKFEAMITLSVANSRMKDFYDLYLLLNSHDFEGRVLQESLFETFSRRGTNLERNPALFSDSFARNQKRLAQWNAFLTRSGLKDIPFETVMARLRTFLQPVYETILAEDEFFKIWSHADQKWE